MIKITKAYHHDSCNSCNSKKDMLNIAISNNGHQFTTFILCKKCRTGLMGMLEKLESSDSDEQTL